MKSRVSLVVPVYNVEQYLDRFFNSLLLQEYQDYKVVVVYDNSQDKSLELLQKWKKSFKQEFHIIMNEKKDGLGFARDVALNSGLIDSEYVTFLDPDDYLEPSFLKKLVCEAQISHSDITICGFKRINEKTQKKIATEMVNPKINFNKNNGMSDIFLINISVWNKLYRTELLTNIRFTNLKRAEDLGFFIFTFVKARKVSFINCCLYNYMIHDSSLSANFKYEHLEALCKYFEKNYDALNENHDFLCAVLCERLMLGCLYRIYTSNKSDYKKSYKLLKTFKKNYVSDVFKTKYLSLFLLLRHGLKGLAIWFYKFFFELNCAFLYFKLYKTVCLLAKKEFH